MYRILIADDEPLEREGMTLILNTMVGRNISILYAENGMEALQQTIIFKPHIALMDIRMPGLDGLRAIKQMKLHLPKIKVVLVSAYEYFDYAKEAMQLGVRDYLVKPARRQEIVDLIQTLLDEVDIEREQDYLSEQKSQKLQLYAEMTQKELALRLMDDLKDEESIYMLAELIDFKFTHCVAIVIAFPKMNLELKPYESVIHDTLRTIFVEKLTTNIAYVVSPIINEHLTIFVSSDERNYFSEIIGNMNDIGESIINSLEILLAIKLFIGIGQVQQELGGITRSYFEAVFASTNVNYEQPICYFSDIEQRLTQPLQVEHSQHAVYVKNAIKQIRQERDVEAYSMISRVTDFIQKNYNRELSLEEAAEHVHLNPFYFSKVFKQLTGDTFIDYLTEVRITHAKKWMEQKELSLKEICYLVGYNDPNYLSRVFKKVVGQTPSEYRQSLH